MRINAINKVKIGDIFINSWGYDQTNIDYYQVVKKSKKTIKIRAISSEVVEDGFMQGQSKPKINDFVGEELQKTPYEYTDDSCLSGRVYLTSTYGSMQKWDGTPQRCSWYA